MPLGDSLPNVICHLEQVLGESSESMMIPWDFGESENACKLVK